MSPKLRLEYCQFTDGGARCVYGPTHPAKFHTLSDGRHISTEPPCPRGCIYPPLESTRDELREAVLSRLDTFSGGTRWIGGSAEVAFADSVIGLFQHFSATPTDEKSA